jgi:predicted DNA-binding transcriptional regulator AlpA
MRLLRKKEAQARIGVGKTKFYEDYIKTGKLRLVPISERIDGILEEEVDAVIAEKIAERDAAKPSSRIPAARDSASGRFGKSTKEIRP